MSVTVVDLAPEHEFEYCRCLESWSDEMAEAGDAKSRWLNKMKDRGLGVKLAIEEENGAYAGMIQYYPTSYSPVSTDEKGIWFIHCIWVHGHKKGQGNHQGHGIGTALLNAAEEDIRNREGLAIAAWGLILPFWMKSRWYMKHGYLRADKDGIRELVIKSLDGQTHSVHWKKGQRPPARRDDGSLNISMFLNGACPVSSIAYSRLIEATADLPVCPELIDTSCREELEKWQQTDALFIGGREIRLGPPPSKRKIRRAVMRGL